MRDFRKERGILFKRARVKMGLKQLEVSKRLGWKTAQQLSNIERGVCDCPWAALPTLTRLVNIPPRLIIESFLEETREELDRSFSEARS